MAVTELAGCVLVAGLLSLTMLCTRVRAPLGADEGYLWFGVQQVLRGRMPHRDFKSYEPGRYLWSAILARVFGPGLLVLRISTHLFFALGLLAALLVLRELGLDWVSVFFAGVVLSVWTHPQHKQFEHAWLLMAWAVDAHALLFPSAPTLLLASTTTGLALFFGFNLFLYLGGALLLALVVASATGLIAPDRPMLAAVVGGGLLGMLPFLLMLSSAGFARNFFRRRVSSVFARGSSNLPLPMPWPWRPLPSQLHGLGSARQRVFQWLFLAMFVLTAGALAMMMVSPGRFGPVAPGILAAAALGLFASHHAASRADPSHIAQAIGPFCLLTILLAKFATPASVIVIAACSLWTVWPLQALVDRRSRSDAFCRKLVGGLQIDLPRDQARLFDTATAMCAGEESNSRGFFAAPAYPALYASLFRDSPVYDTFCLYPADENSQQEMIEAIERAGVFAALVSDAAIDGREELRFSRTHPRVWAHLREKFHSVRLDGLGTDVLAFTASGDASTKRVQGPATCGLPVPVIEATSLHT